MVKRTTVFQRYVGTVDPQLQNPGSQKHFWPKNAAILSPNKCNEYLYINIKIKMSLYFGSE